ncbi:MAG TPA: ThuA domain-containing protein [Planctomycetota bacterium]|nr:ThuA domain-containing protein [Planctomycetota bacterium]
MREPRSPERAKRALPKLVTLSFVLALLSTVLASCAGSGVLRHETVSASAPAIETEPLRVLLVTGGCCHDYDRQKTVLAEGLSARANVRVTIVHEGGSRDENVREQKLSVFLDPTWPEKFDVVVHDTCFGALADNDYVSSIVDAHEEHGVGAVILHCGLHSYRNIPEKTWHRFLGVASKRHERGAPVPVENARPSHPIMKGFPDRWSTPSDELYVVHETWPGIVTLGLAWGKETRIHHPVIWTNESRDARIFGVSFGHSNETVEDERYLDLVARGLLWTAGKLTDEGKPAAGYEPIRAAAAKEGEA